MRVLQKQGYTEYKAFEMVGAQIEEVLRKQTDETRILRGVALQSNVYTYLERVQQLAEAESAMKVEKLERDMPKFLRAQRNYIKEFEDEEKRINEQAAKAVGLSTSDFLEGEGSATKEFDYHPEDIEKMMFKRKYDYEGDHKFEKYQPVMYEIIKDPRELADKESLYQTQERFLDRTERLLQLHHQRSHINDGLKHLSDNQLIQKVREAPTQLKRSARSFLRKL